MRKNPQIISVGGGKGGIGKSTVSVNLGAALARKNFSVGFIDADLGGANLHLLLGIKRPRKSLNDYLSGRVSDLSEVKVCPQLKNSWLISGSSDIYEISNPRFMRKQKLLNAIRKLDADFIFIDLKAGNDNHVIDFYNAFPSGIIVSDSTSPSIENAYGFMKNSVVRGIIRKYSGNRDVKKFVKRFSNPVSEKGFVTLKDMLFEMQYEFADEKEEIERWLLSRKHMYILNMAESRKDIDMMNSFVRIVNKYLNLKLYYIGYVISDTQFRKSLKKNQPAIVFEKDNPVYRCFDSISDNLIALTKG